MSYDPRLKECMAKIEALCKEYDFAAYISLVSETHGEFRFHWPTWSAVYEEFDSTGAVKGVRLKTVNMKHDPVVRHKAEMAAHICFSQRDVAAQAFSLYDHLCKTMKEKWNTEHVPFADFRPHRKDEN